MKRDLFRISLIQTALIEALSPYSDKSKEIQYVCQALAFSGGSSSVGIAAAISPKLLSSVFSVNEGACSLTNLALLGQGSRKEKHFHDYHRKKFIYYIMFALLIE